MTISPINNVNNNIRNLSFGENKEKPDTEKESQISTQTKVIVGTGLAALAAVGIYIALVRGKVKPNIPNINGSENVQDTENINKINIDEIISLFKSKNPSGSVSIKKNKNGETYVKLINNNVQENPFLSRDMYVINKNGTLNHRIWIGKMGKTHVSCVTGPNDLLLRECEARDGCTSIKKRFPDGKVYKKFFVEGQNDNWTILI